MRFKTRVDPGFVAILVLFEMVWVAGIVRFYLIRNSHPTPPFFFPMSIITACMICGGVFAKMLPQYYEIRETGLFLRQGRTKTLIPYEFLVAVAPYSSSDRAWVFSSDRVLAVTNGGNRFVIAVAEEKRFLTELWKRCPQLNPATEGQSLHSK
jgi:hypothetical protein